MADSTTYYSIVVGNQAGDPKGLARRRYLSAGGFVDESLRRDLTWGHTSAIIESRRDAMDFSLVEISEDEAERLIERFRAKWADEG